MIHVLKVNIYNLLNDSLTYVQSNLMSCTTMIDYFNLHNSYLMIHIMRY
jgi:hypothetical protein